MTTPTEVEEDYFLGRMAASLALARAAASSIARLAHFELAGRYSVAAVAARRGVGTLADTWNRTRHSPI